MCFFLLQLNHPPLSLMSSTVMSSVFQKKEFTLSHIPGASFFDIDECWNSQFDHALPSEQFFCDFVGNLGIGNDIHVIVYDASDIAAFMYTSFWWMFRLFGHPQVSVLNGGFRNWVKQGHLVTDTHTKP